MIGPSLTLLALCLALAALFASSASALDINTEVKMPEGEVGQAYEFEFDGEEGCQPYNFALHAGQLPPGLTLSQGGELSGTAEAAGIYTFWVELTDGVPGGACHSPTPSQGEYSIIIAPNIEITAVLPGAKVGAPFTSIVTATGGGSLQWNVTEGSLPPGLTLNRDTGTLAGVPSTVGTYPFTIQVRDDKRRATRQYSFVVATPLAGSASQLPVFEVGVAASAQIPSSGGIGPFVWAAAAGASLPAGLTLDPATGKITGTPTAAGSYTVPIDVIDTDGQSVQITIAGAVVGRLGLGTLSARSARVGTAYRLQRAKTGGVGPVRWGISAGKLPRGLALDGATGKITGTPRTAGTSRFTVKVTDKLGITATRAVKVTVSRV